jgi:hypothetical protein
MSVANQQQLQPSLLERWYTIGDSGRRKSVGKWVTTTMKEATQVVNGVTSTKYTLPIMGTLILYRNLVATEEQQAMANEILTCKQQCNVQIAGEGNSTETQPTLLLRQHFIQNSPEPRLHCLLHENYNCKSISQPGYKYSNVTMKAQSLEGLDALKSFSTCLERICCMDNPNCNSNNGKGCFWNIGINPVLYRDGSDYMGFHADDDQGETLIVTAVIIQPKQRGITIRPKDHDKKGQKIEYLLKLNVGDAYSMDGEYRKGLEAQLHTKISTNLLIAG